MFPIKLLDNYTLFKTILHDLFLHGSTAVNIYLLNLYNIIFYRMNVCIVLRVDTLGCLNNLTVVFYGVYLKNLITLSF